MSQGESPADASIDFAEYGEAEAHFRVGGYHYRMLQVGGIVGIVVGLAFLGLIGALVCFGGRGPQGREWSSLLHGVVFALAALAAGAAALSRSRNYRGLQVLVCSRGLVWVREDGIQYVSWSSIRAIRRVPKSVTGIGHSWQPGLQFVLERVDGTKLELDETLHDLEQLRELVEQHTLDHLLAPALEQLRDGKTVAFGASSVSQEGIEAGKAMLPWARFGYAVVERGQVSIYDESGKSFCKLETSAVPNAHVLLALSDFLGGTGKVKSISEGLSS